MRIGVVLKKRSVSGWRLRQDKAIVRATRARGCLLSSETETRRSRAAASLGRGHGSLLGRRRKWAGGSTRLLQLEFGEQHHQQQEKRQVCAVGGEGTGGDNSKP